ncbi:MAG: High-affinity branched-chain amino acid transport system permease protein LivH [Acidimicrobiaceae bacterium]|jgi:branched-chain amino acid transport system permease protein|nr:High-affinity branched-chain amino acid transport system permease protein LivH [Acidimicrobiaceae bacterium]
MSAGAKSSTEAYVSDTGVSTGRRSAIAAAWLVFGALLLVFPILFSNPTVTTIAVFTLIYMTAATAWNGFAGYSGYIPLGHAVFFGVGAYTMALVSLHLNLQGGYEMFALVPLAGVAAAVIAVPFGLIALRTRRHTFVVITIAVFFIVQLLAFNLGFTQGSSGVQVATPLWTAASFNDRFYYAALVILLIAVLVSWGIRRSRFGLQLLAIRDDEDRARGLGVKVQRVKLLGFVLSGVTVGMVGALYAFFIGQIYPQFAFDPLFDVTIALMAFFGGLGTISGPLLGALILEPLQQYLTLQYSVGSLYLIIYGALFLIVILTMPRGIIPTIGDRLAMRRAERLGREESPSAAPVSPPVEVAPFSGAAR